jgi:hypothetical protein
MTPFLYIWLFLPPFPLLQFHHLIAYRINSSIKLSLRLFTFSAHVILPNAAPFSKPSIVPSFEQANFRTLVFTLNSDVDYATRNLHCNVWCPQNPSVYSLRQYLNRLPGPFKTLPVAYSFHSTPISVALLQKLLQWITKTLLKTNQSSHLIPYILLASKPQFLRFSNEYIWFDAFKTLVIHDSLICIV